MSSTPLAISLARRAAPFGARGVTAACLLAAPALIACGDNRYCNPPYDEALAKRIRVTRSITRKPKE